MNWLPVHRFAQVVADAPLVALDLVVQRGQGAAQEVLLGFRNNRPAQGFWFVPGGRIHKGEALQAALARTVQTELGLSLAEALAAGARLQWLGVYQHFYADSFADAAVPTHYVVLAHALIWPRGDVVPVPAPDVAGQHARWRWWPVAQALASPEVHPHTQDYLGTDQPVLGGRN